MLRKLLLIVLVALVAAIVCYNPSATSEPGANPNDPASSPHRLMASTVGDELRLAVSSVTAWPAHDLFAEFP